jgi:hypothetical protein
MPERINDVKSMAITNIEIPVSFYNISSSLGNNYCKITKVFQPTIGTTTDQQGLLHYNGVVDNTKFFITLPDGNYTIQDILGQINTQLSSVALRAMLASMEDVNHKTRLYNGDHVYFRSDDGSKYNIEFAVDSLGNPDRYNIKSKLGWLLGFREPTMFVDSWIASNLSLVSDYYTIQGKRIYAGHIGEPLYLAECNYDIWGPRYMYLAVEEFSKGTQTSFVSPLFDSMINKNIIARIAMNPTVHGYGTILPANRFNGLLMSDVRTYTGKIDLQRLHVQLLNEFGLPINLNGLDFSFCCELEHEA